MLRFRSSSNAEDSQDLTGAGLYDSFSGCIADDTDGDNQGPSHGDPNEPEERGVLRAIEKVFASFYNENAWLERLRHGVPEQDTGMAVLVHQNFPDQDGDGQRGRHDQLPLTDRRFGEHPGASRWRTTRNEPTNAGR